MPQQQVICGSFPKAMRYKEGREMAGARMKATSSIRERCAEKVDALRIVHMQAQVVQQPARGWLASCIYSGDIEV